MSRPLKYGEPMIGMYIRVPQSRKEEIRELVRERLNGNDGWVDIIDAEPPQNSTVLTYGEPCYGGVGISLCNHLDGIYRFALDDDRENKHYISAWKQVYPPKSK